MNRTRSDLQRPRPASFHWVRPRAAPQHGEGSQVSGVQLVEVLYGGAVEFVAEVFGAEEVPGLAKLSVRPVLKAVDAVFDAPVRAGETLTVGVGLSTLSSRSFVLDAAAWLPGDLLASHGSVSFVVFDVAAANPVAVPADIVARLKDSAVRPESP